MVFDLLAGDFTTIHHYGCKFLKWLERDDRHVDIDGHNAGQRGGDVVDDVKDAPADV